MLELVSPGMKCKKLCLYNNQCFHDYSVLTYIIPWNILQISCVYKLTFQETWLIKVISVTCSSFILQCITSSFFSPCLSITSQLLSFLQKLRTLSSLNRMFTTSSLNVVIDNVSCELLNVMVLICHFVCFYSVKDGKYLLATTGWNLWENSD